ncbi:hypothetical protein ACHHYP_20019 [Achlya hypogyna]|uniref:Retrotransposon gag domain-containing protein n=1 Tax=Achlya hypogyna TaxID=1202772 RepID=A0A1V9ZAR2_ACHHY|nr:hypothetical protein ACHHYP_20019 [Achlya hypogyna]
MVERSSTALAQVSYDEFKASRYDGLEEAYASFAAMHRELASHKTKVRQEKRNLANRGNKAKPRKFAIGNFVQWYRPWVVVSTITSWVYTVEEVQFKKHHDCNVCVSPSVTKSSTIMVFSNFWINPSTGVMELIMVFSNFWINPSTGVMELIMVFSNFWINSSTGVMELECAWLGMEGETTWEPVSTLHEYPFQMYKAYMRAQLAQLDPTSPAYGLATTITAAYPISTDAIVLAPKSSSATKKSKSKSTPAPAKKKTSKNKFPMGPLGHCRDNIHTQNEVAATLAIHEEARRAAALEEAARAAQARQDEAHTAAAAREETAFHAAAAREEAAARETATRSQHASTPELLVEGLRMPEYHGLLDESVSLYVHRVTTFFRAKNINPHANAGTEARCLAMIVANLHGLAASWYLSCVSRGTQPTTMVAFAAQLREPFEPPDHQERLRDQLYNWRQKDCTNLMSYVGRFRARSAQISDMTALDMTMRFMRGLRMRTREAVQYKRPLTRSSATNDDNQSSWCSRHA